MKLTVHLILIALVLAVPFWMRRPASSEAGGESGTVRRLVVVTPHNQDIRREFERAFDAWYLERYGQSVTIDYRSVGGTNDIKRLLATTYNALRVNGQLPAGASSGIDVVWGGGDFFFDHDLKPLGILVPLKLDPKVLSDAFPQPTLAGVRLYDGSRDSGGEPTPQWVGVCLSSFGIVYNADLYRHGALDLEPPQRWADLADEKLAGYVALADPTHSGSAAVAYLMVIQRAMADAEGEIFARRPDLAKMPATRRAEDSEYGQALAAGWKKGMGQLVLIAANARYFTDSATAPPADVANGQAAAGMAIDFYGRVYEETVGPGRCRFVLPEAATAITPDPVAVLRGADVELANRFVEFLLTARGQRLWDLKVGGGGGPRRSGPCADGRSGAMSMRIGPDGRTMSIPSRWPASSTSGRPGRIC